MGEAELVTAFRFVGVEGVAVSGEEDARQVFHVITGAADTGGNETLSAAAGCRILVMTEQTADFLGESLTRWQLSGRYPLIVEIPGLGGRLPGRKTLVDSIREAIGIHV
jgi:V/A-type H+-transporting ATPase subunit F